MKRLGVRFSEVMEGSVQRHGERFDRPFVVEIDASAPDVLRFATTARAEARGKVRIDGLAKRAEARGTMEISPLEHRRIGYALEFSADDGKRYRFEGHKTITGLTHTGGWTTLPGEIVAEGGEVYGRAVLRFVFAKHLPAMLRSFRFGTPAPEVAQ